MVTDEALYARTLAGDRTAMAELAERYHGTLYRFLCRMTGDPQAALDLVQEAFIRLITYRGKVPRRFRSWVFTVARNLAYDRFRSAPYRREGAGGEGGEDDTAHRGNGRSLDDLVQRNDERQVVVEALQELSPAHREVLVLRFYHDLSLEEIAEVTAAPLGTVKSRLFYALKQLKDCLERNEVLHVG